MNKYKKITKGYVKKIENCYQLDDLEKRIQAFIDSMQIDDPTFKFLGSSITSTKTNHWDGANMIPIDLWHGMISYTKDVYV